MLLRPAPKRTQRRRLQSPGPTKSTAEIRGIDKITPSNATDTKTVAAWKSRAFIPLATVGAQQSLPENADLAFRHLFSLFAKRFQNVHKGYLLYNCITYQ